MLDPQQPRAPRPVEAPAGSPNQKRFGIGMIIGAWLLVMALLAIPLTNLLEDRNNPRRAMLSSHSNGGENVVTLRRNRQGHYVSPGKINGRPVSFLLDTGATVVSIPASIAHDLGLQRGRSIRIGTANGTRRAYKTTLASIQLGSIGLSGIPAVINPGHDDKQILLGMSFLKEIEFTQRGRELTLRQIVVR